MTLVAGIDSSTQSCTIVLRDADDGRIVATARAPHPPTTPPVSEQHPSAWWSALRDAARQLDLSKVEALSVAGQGHGLVVLDDRREVIRPAKLWNDTTSATEATELVERLGRESWAQRVGTVPTAAFTITKLLWLARHEPENFGRVAAVLLPADWIMFQLTGAFRTDRSAASGTGYFSPSEGTWLADLLAEVGGKRFHPELPTVVGPEEVAGRVGASAAAELGLPAGALVGPGCNDQPPAALAFGAARGDVIVSLGTSGTVFTPSETPTHDSTGLVTGVCDAAGGFLPLICTLNAAKATDAFARLLGVDHQELTRLALAAPPDPDRPVLVPYLDGERTPNRPRARGAMGWLRSDLTREAAARAAFEGVVLGLLDGLDALRAAGARVDGRLIATGGGARSRAYQQYVADLFERSVNTSDITETAAAGAAVQAAAVLHGRKVADVAAAWAPELRQVAAPRAGQATTQLRRRYHRLARMEELDG